MRVASKIWSPNTWVGRIAAGLVGLLGVIYFYRDFFTSGFLLGQGDNGDGRLTQVIAAHWAKPWQFPGGFTDIGIFFPLGKGLMYSDTMLVFGLFGAPLQWLGVNPSIAFQWSLIAVSLLGYTASVILMRWGARAAWPLAITTGLVVTFSNGLFVSSNHPQLLAYNLLPVIALLVLTSARATNPLRMAVASVAAGATFGLTLYSAFYIGWMAFLASVFVIPLWFVIVRDRSLLIRLSGPRGLRILALATGFIPFAVLMVLTYAPLIGVNTPRPLEDARYFALRLPELLGVSPTNAVWSTVLEALVGPLRDEEFGMAPTPMVILVAGVLLVMALVSRSLRHQTWLGLGVACTLVGFGLWLLPVDWGGFFPWTAVYQLPGAGAIRAIGRIELIAGGLLVWGAALIANALWKRASRGVGAQVLAVLLLLAVVVEQANVGDRQEVDLNSVQAIREIPDPPKYCSSFALLPPFNPDRPYDSQTDAALIAQEFGIPTWNGQSGGFPPGWTLYPMDNPDGYMRLLQEYPERYGVDRGCLLHLPTREWIPFELARERRIF